MCIGHHVTTGYACSVFMELEFYGEILEKYSDLKVHEGMSSG
jgi:hypothetical protein